MRYLNIFILFIILGFPSFSHAQDRYLTDAGKWLSEVTPELSIDEIRRKFEDKEIEYERSNGFSYNLSNENKEQRFQLFLKSMESENSMIDVTDEDLNRIAPAAGIKFRMPIQF